MKKITLGLLVFFALFFSKSFAWSGDYLPFSYITLNANGSFCADFWNGTQCRSDGSVVFSVSTALSPFLGTGTPDARYTILGGFYLPFTDWSFPSVYNSAGSGNFSSSYSSTGDSLYLDIRFSLIPGKSGVFSFNDHGKDLLNGYCDVSTPGRYFLDSTKKTLILCKVSQSFFKQLPSNLLFSGSTINNFVSSSVQNRYNWGVPSSSGSLTNYTYLEETFSSVDHSVTRIYFDDIPIYSPASDGGSGSEIPIFSWSGSTVTGSLASVINDLENTYGLDSSYCSSGAWSGIVNSPQQLYTRSERSTAIYNYCGYLRAVGSGQTELIVGFGDQTETTTQTGALITINQAITDQRGIDQTRCSSGAWSGIVNSPTQLYVRSREATEVWKYCKNNQLILSGQSELTINFNSYPYGKFFTCSHWLVTTGFVTINLSNTIPKVGLFSTKGSFIDFDLAKPVRCMYSSYLYGSNQSKFTFDSMPWTGQLFFKSSPYYQTNNTTNKSFLIWFLNLVLSFPAFFLAIKRMK